MKPFAFAVAATLGAFPASLAVVAQAETGAEAVEGLAVLGKPVTRADLQAGRVIYLENCASCHGEQLEGQPDWRRRLDNGRMPAPPHDETGHTWHHSDRALFLLTKSGVGAVVAGYESDMPAFGETLTDAEIAAVLAFIKSTWPERQRMYQAEISENDKREP